MLETSSWESTRSFARGCREWLVRECAVANKNLMEEKLTMTVRNATPGRVALQTLGGATWSVVTALSSSRSERRRRSGARGAVDATRFNWRWRTSRPVSLTIEDADLVGCWCIVLYKPNVGAGLSRCEWRNVSDRISRNEKFAQRWRKALHSLDANETSE